MWPKNIRTRAESLTLLVILSVFTTYFSAFALSVTRFVA